MQQSMVHFYNWQLNFLNTIKMFYSSLTLILTKYRNCHERILNVFNCPCLNKDISCFFETASSIIHSFQ